MREMRNIKKMINRANILKEYDKQNSLEYFVIDDFIYNLSATAIKDIKANEKKGIAYDRSPLSRLRKQAAMQQDRLAVSGRTQL